MAPPISITLWEIGLLPSAMIVTKDNPTAVKKQDVRCKGYSTQNWEVVITYKGNQVLGNNPIFPSGQGTKYLLSKIFNKPTCHQPFGLTPNMKAEMSILWSCSLSIPTTGFSSRGFNESNNEGDGYTGGD